jgi:hypothetical protein
VLGECFFFGGGGACSWGFPWNFLEFRRSRCFLGCSRDFPRFRGIPGLFLDFRALPEFCCFRDVPGIFQDFPGFSGGGQGTVWERKGTMHSLVKCHGLLPDFSGVPGILPGFIGMFLDIPGNILSCPGFSGFPNTFRCCSAISRSSQEYFPGKGVGWKLPGGFSGFCWGCPRRTRDFLFLLLISGIPPGI